MGQKELTSVIDIKTFVEETIRSGDRVSSDRNEHYDPRWFDWQRHTITKVASLLRLSGFELINDTPRIEDIEIQAASFPENGYAIYNPGPKSVESIERKIRRPDVDGAAEVFDFLRFTVIIKNKIIGEQVALAIRSHRDHSDYFSPLHEEERILRTGRIIPEENQLGNRLSAPALASFLSERPSEWGINMRLKTGSAIPEVPPHMRIEIRIMTPGLWRFMHDPQSPADPIAYSFRQG